MKLREWTVQKFMDAVLGHYGFWVVSVLVGLFEAFAWTNMGFVYSVHKSTCGIFSSDMSILIPQYITKCLLFIGTVGIGGLVTTFCLALCAAWIAAATHDVAFYIASPKKPKKPKYKSVKPKTPFGNGVKITTIGKNALPPVPMNKRFWKRAFLSLLLTKQEFWSCVVAVVLYVPAILVDAWIIHNAQECLAKPAQIASVTFAATLAIGCIIIAPIQFAICKWSLVRWATDKSKDALRSLEKNGDDYCTYFYCDAITGTRLTISQELIAFLQTEYNMRAVSMGSLRLFDTDAARLDLYFGDVSDATNAMDVYIRHSEKFDCLTFSTDQYGWSVFEKQADPAAFVTPRLGLDSYSKLSDVQSLFESFIKDSFVILDAMYDLKGAGERQNERSRKAAEERLAKQQADEAAAEALAESLDLGTEPEVPAEELSLEDAYDSVVEALNEAECIVTEARIALEDLKDSINFEETSVALEKSSEASAKAVEASNKVNAQAIIDASKTLQDLVNKLKHSC